MRANGLANYSGTTILLAFYHYLQTLNLFRIHDADRSQGMGKDPLETLNQFKKTVGKESNSMTLPESQPETVYGDHGEKL